MDKLPNPFIQDPYERFDLDLERFLTDIDAPPKFLTDPSPGIPDRLRAWSGARYPGRALNMPDFKQYRRTQIAEMMPWVRGLDMDGVSISQPDREAGSPTLGDMIARDPKNHDDQWLVAAKYFADNFEPV